MELNKLYLGDCLEVMPREIPNKSVDMILCDLPYGTTNCSWDSVIPLDLLWGEYKKIIKDNCPIVLFGNQPFTTDLINSNREWFKYEMVWNKMTTGQPQLAKIKPLSIHENIIIFGNGKITYYPQMTKADESKNRPLRTVKSSGIKHISGSEWKTEENYNNKLRYPTSIFPYSSRNAECNMTKRLHPTQKPVILLEYLIKTYTNPGDLVLDNCAGSGSTLVAARRTNRNFIGIEQDQNYFDIANRRLQQELI